MDALSQMFDDALRNARTAERLHAAISTLGPVTKAIGDVQSVDPDLAPEIGNACEHLEELLASLDRASKVNETKFELAMERARAAYGLPKGA